MDNKEKIRLAINQIPINNCDGSANEDAIKAVRYLQEVSEAINYTHCYTELPTSTQLLSDCKKRFKELEGKGNLDYRSYQNGYMEINSKYRLEEFPLNLRVIEAFDFEIEPILLLEQDSIGNNFLSYLTYSDFKKEQRACLQISKERLNEILANEITLKFAFENPENNHIFITEFTHKTGSLITSYLIPKFELENLFNALQRN